MNEHKPLQDNFKKKQRKAVLRLVALLLVTATLISTAAWSWFADNQEEVTASGLQIAMESQDLLEMSVNGSSWSTELDLSDILSGIDLVPLTGLGYKIGENDDFLYIPELSYNEDGTAEVEKGANVSWYYPEANKDYISLQIKFRTKSESVRIYLGDGTSVTTGCEDTGQLLVGADSGNKSKYGDFSYDAIVGALRMSVSSPLDSSGMEDLTFIWIPRPEIKFEGYSELGRCDVNANLPKDEWEKQHVYYMYIPGKTQDKGICSKCLLSESVFEAKLSGSEPADSKACVGTTSAYDATTDYYTCTVNIRIWLDGIDSEAARALAYGKFRFNLNFVGFK